MTKAKVGGFDLSKIHSSYMAWIILALSVLVTIAASAVSNSWIEKAAKTRFGLKSDDARSAIVARMKEQEAALWAGIGVIRASDDVSRHEWQTFVETLRIDRYLPGLQGFGYAEFVAPEERERHVQRVRAEGFPDYDIKPEGVRDLYSAIIYLEPFDERNQRAFGYDMWSNETRRAAMSRAIDTGEPAVSGMVTLVQENGADVQRGFLMYLPHYRAGLPTETVEQRRAAIAGFVYSPFRIKDLMEGIIGKGDAEIDFRIYDAEEISPDALMYDSAADYSDAPGDPAGLTRTVAVDIGGHVWTLVFRTKPGFTSFSQAMQPVFIAIGGLIIDILLFLVIWSQSNQRRRAEELAGEMTREMLAAKDEAERAVAVEAGLRQSVEETNRKLVNANEGLIRFTSIMAHDLRAPLKRVESFVQVLDEDYSSTLDVEGHHILSRITSSATSMRKLLDSLHGYSKVGGQDIKVHPWRLKAIAQNALDVRADELREADVVLDIDDDVEILCDPGLLENVILNLVGNALKFRSKDKVRIEIDARYRGDDMVVVSVGDNGIGIDPQFSAKIFEMLGRLHNDDEFEGTGIGLAVCRKIILDHGGDIWLDPECKSGARFCFTIKRAVRQDALEAA